MVTEDRQTYGCLSENIAAQKHLSHCSGNCADLNVIIESAIFYN